jgi:hypothetical protein
MRFLRIQVMKETRRRSKAIWITSIAFAAVILVATAGERWILGGLEQARSKVSPTSTAPTTVFSSPTLIPSPSPEYYPTVQMATETQILAPQFEEPALHPTTGNFPPRRTAPVVGGADKVAFFNEGEIWVVNLDGGELEQLTRDGIPKSNLQWSRDGNSVYFLSNNCIQAATLGSLGTHPVLCMEGAGQLSTFQFSQGEGRLALVFDRALYILDNDQNQILSVKTLSDLWASAACPSLAPYVQNGRVVTVNSARWSQDSGQLAIVRPGLDDGKLVDMVHILDITGCESSIRRLDEFPAKRFTMSGYDTRPVLQNVAWDGWKLFALISYRRNEGFGDLWVYNEELYTADLINPVEGACCYRDPFFSPDGNYLLFAFQDKRLAPASEIRLYYVPLATVGTGLAYAPIPLPAGFFPDPHSQPQPVLRTAR